MTKDHDYWSCFDVLECAWYGVILLINDGENGVRLETWLACWSEQLINELSLDL